mgnify:FL=1
MKTELSLEIPHDLLAPAKEVIANLQKDQANPNYRPMIYICAPYTAVVMNNRKVIRQVENYCRFVYECGGIPICPQLYLPRFLNLRNYNELNAAVFMDIDWMRKCSEIWAFGKLTGDMKWEIKKAQKKDQPVRYFTESLEVIK